MKFTRACLVLTSLALVASAGQALAEKKHGRGPDNGRQEHSSSQNRGDDDVRVLIALDSRDRSIIRDYLGRDYKANCPPGLAKKRNGCLPPGIAKKYAIGQRLPPYVPILPLPGDLLGRLSPLPPGYMYGRVDGDVLLMTEAGHKVIDAITLLSAVGN